MPIVFKEEITNAGLSLSYDPQSWGGTDALLCLYTTSAVTLGGNIGISITSDFNVGCGLTIIQSASIDRNGRTLNVVPPTGGLTYNANWQFITPSVIYMKNIDGTNYSFATVWNVLSYGTSGGGIDATEAILDASIGLSKLADLTAAQIIVGNSSDRPTAVAVTGDVTISNTGVTAIGAGVIVNADVNASAAIARSKLASGTASQVLINDGSGVMTSEAQLAKSRGGFGQDVSASTGFVKFASGTLSISSIVESRDYQVSFESGEVGADNTYTLGFNCTLTPTDCSAFVIKAIAATDDAVITLLKNGVAISSGTITFAASSAQDASGVFGAFSATSFTAGDTISLQSSKPTAGGKVCVTLQFTRTQ